MSLTRPAGRTWAVALATCSTTAKAIHKMSAKKAAAMTKRSVRAIGECSFSTSDCAAGRKSR